MGIVALEGDNIRSRKNGTVEPLFRVPEIHKPVKDVVTPK
jgi:hypothetical protein